MSGYTEEQLAAWREARRLFPGLLSTISDQESLIESHAELSARVAELEAENKLLRNTLVSKALPDGEISLGYESKEGWRE